MSFYLNCDENLVSQTNVVKMDVYFKFYRYWVWQLQSKTSFKKKGKKYFKSYVIAFGMTFILWHTENMKPFSVVLSSTGLNV